MMVDGLPNDIISMAIFEVDSACKHWTFKLMEVRPSISWKYFHWLDGFKKMAISYNCCHVNVQAPCITVDKL